MAEKKYAKYILTDLKLPEDQQSRAEEYAKRATRILWLEDFVIPGTPSIILSWYWKAAEKAGSPAHTHDFDEVVGFIGSDPENPRELFGEVEFWLEDEKYNLTESCLIYCPKGLRHCPLRVVRADKPILFLAVSMSNKYYKIMDAPK
jgi:quercetin dioxygenase-like cupin family protein